MATYKLILTENVTSDDILKKLSAFEELYGSKTVYVCGNMQISEYNPKKRNIEVVFNVKWQVYHIMNGMLNVDLPSSENDCTMFLPSAFKDLYVGWNDLPYLLIESKDI